ncbi:uncharacterized protein [Diadema antillarum]|uniref:uncharacterized protein n=1 Tax=Diadema antillarum TaxID=105358 RepID=UPI003A835209
MLTSTRRVVVVPLLALSLLLPLSWQAIIECAKKSGSSARFYGVQDSSMEVAYFEEQNITVYDCARRCRADTVCLSYSYSKNLEMCRHFVYDRETAPELLVSSTGHDYYDMIEQKTDNPHYGGTCNVNQCRNGGACRTDCSDQGYYCKCADGYHGELCETEYFNEAELVQTIYSDLGRDSMGFTFDNMHFLVITTLLTTNDAGDADLPSQIVYRYNYTSQQYDWMQSLSGLGRAIKASAFQLSGKQYFFICNYREWDGNQDADSYVWVYDNSTDSFVTHQTIATKGCVTPATLRSTEHGFYLFISNYYAPSSYTQNSQVYKWYPRYERFVWIHDISTTGAFMSDIFEIDSVIYVAVPFYRDGSNYELTSEVWGQSGSYDIHRGCYIDGTSRALDGDSFSSDSMTVTLCITYCRDRGYPYAGLQASSHCFCGDEDYSEHGEASSGDCNQQCTGDSSSYCGGSWRNNIYSTDQSWTNVQDLPGSPGAATGAKYYSHGGSHYLVITRYADSEECNKDMMVYVWNAGSSEWEVHQTITLEWTCPIDAEIFEVE